MTFIGFLIFITLTDLALQKFYYKGTLLTRRGTYHKADYDEITWVRKDESVGWLFSKTHKVGKLTKEINTNFDFESQIFYQANKQGYRHHKDFEKLNASKRIVFASDSMLFGPYVEYEKIATSLVQKKLPDHDVINLSIPGWGIDQMFWAVEDNYEKIKIDKVFFAITDYSWFRMLYHFRISEGFSKPIFEIENGELIKKVHPTKTFFENLAEKSYFLNSLYWVDKDKMLIDLGVGIVKKINDFCSKKKIECTIIKLPLDVEQIGLTEEIIRRADGKFVEFKAKPGYSFEDDFHYTVQGHAGIADQILNQIIKKPLK